MRKVFLVISIYAALTGGAVGGGDNKLTSESMGIRFSDVRIMLNKKGPMNYVGPVIEMRTEFGTPIRQGLCLKSDDLGITVDSASGRILSIESVATSNIEGGPTLNEKQSEKIGKMLVRKIRPLDDSEMTVIYNKYDVSTACWKITWERMADGYPFPEETIFVSFDDKARSMVSFRDKATDNRCPTTPIIEEKIAWAAAEHCVNALLPEMFGEFYEIDGVPQGKLQVVYPNGQYVFQARRVGAGPSAVRPQPRLVYSYDLSFRYTGTATLRRATYPVVVWVDALTGDVVGGL